MLFLPYSSLAIGNTNSLKMPVINIRRNIINASYVSWSQLVQPMPLPFATWRLDPTNGLMVSPRPHSPPFNTCWALCRCCSAYLLLQPHLTLTQWLHILTFLSTQPLLSYPLPWPQAKQEYPLCLTASLLLHLFYFLIKFGLSHTQNPYKTCDARVNIGCVALLCMVWNQWLP